MTISAKNKIQEIAPTFIGNFTNIETSQSVWETYQAKIEKYKESIGLPAKYFFYHSHDSSILSLSKTNKKDLYLVLNDISTLEFACALIDKKELKINKEQMEFPIEIYSENTKHLSLNMVDAANGELQPCRFRKVDEYLYEEIIIWDENNIEIAFDLWSNRCNPANRYVLLLSCEKIIINENQYSAWQRYFSDKMDKYFDFFNSKRNEGVFLSDYSQCLQLIDEYDAIEKPLKYT